jgi:hypothetical protein
MVTPETTPIRWIDRLTPTAVLLVSRAWVLREIASLPALSEARRAELVDALIAYEPERRHGLRNNFVAWLLMLGGTGVARLAGIAPWIGFIGGLLVVLLLARMLAVRALRWKLARLVAGADDR